ncbi:MAG TPA: hypothetical protein PLB91_14680 [Spirochaetales bacterium]|nr:hypothetical protein [Spirochaetales bacterium]HRY53599.1 hypothetical protein [Spirochaetia bacterium]
MNQDRVKEILLRVAEPQTEFSVIFSGKESSLVNGLYKPATREIVIHNRNFDSDDQLVYTALHEYAHHLHGERKGGLSQGRAHTNEFWGIFHELLVEAEAKGLYRNVFDVEPEFVELTRKIKGSCIAENGRVMLEFGKLMVEAQALCAKFKARFEDYVDRALGVPRATASTAARAVSYGVDPEVGWDGMRMAAGIRDPGERAQALEALRGGASPAAVKARFASSRPPEDAAERLASEKARLERTIQNLEERLAEVERRLAEMGEG